MSLTLDLFTVAAVSLGAVFFLAGTLGLLRFPDTLSRLHALTKADNLGLGLVVLGLLPQVASPLGWIGLIAVWLLALLSGATAGQLLAGAVRPPEWARLTAPGPGKDTADD
ncbi:MAG: monovalent cation/H(+) antiporter subunit G [Thiocapsa sp.]|jgi:multicomponent Na+:H+ antiporter subunit G|nr:monovalent cation/H(+) antiporter subunit G [Thiocapsa sp.]MCG6895759.1 monovalent cation/H(+) antiporter subunit G [Thiocapsa sp.]MCG6985291.1 monovalent cation/H(+) antiporter subunit G [Thiocapsa sp.]